MSELRKDPITGRWVIVKTEHCLRPEDYELEPAQTEFRYSPFTYGREKHTPPEVDAFRKDGAPNTPGWSVRVVPNKFPALKIEGGLDYQQNGVFERLNGIGAHEVLIETPDAKKQMADFSDEEIKDVIAMYQRRYNDLSGDERFKYIMIFKNYGRTAGATIDHAHSQIIALPMVPKYVEEKIDGAQEYHKRNKQFVYSDMVTQEKRDAERVIGENDEFICFCPFVPRYAFEIWIVPKNHESYFSKLNDGQRLQLAQILKDALTRLKIALKDPAFNYYLLTHPINSDPEHTFLWHIEIVPKLTQYAEFDRDSGFYVIQTSPKEAARYIREAASAGSPA